MKSPYSTGNQIPDYYHALSISRKATEVEINKAFRKLSIKYHPDKTGNDPRAAETFKMLSGYRDVLVDAKKRDQYDNHLMHFEHYQPHDEPQTPSTKPWAASKKPAESRKKRRAPSPIPEYRQGFKYDPWGPDPMPTKDWRSPPQSPATPDPQSKPRRRESGPGPKSRSVPKPESTPKPRPEGKGSFPDGPKPQPNSPSPDAQKPYPQPQSNSGPAYWVRESSLEVLFCASGVTVAIECSILMTELSRLYERIASDLDWGRVCISDPDPMNDACLLVRLISFAQHKCMMDRAPLISFKSEYGNFEDLYADAGTNAFTAAVLYTRMYILACESGMSVVARHHLRKRFIAVWTWLASNGPARTDEWLDLDSNCPEFQVHQLRLLCDLAKFVYTFAPQGDRALRDPVARTLLLHMDDDSQNVFTDISPIMELTSLDHNIAKDLAVLKIERHTLHASGCPLGHSQRSLRIPCRCGKYECGKADCWMIRNARRFCSVCTWCGSTGELPR